MTPPLTASGSNRLPTAATKSIGINRNQTNLQYGSNISTLYPQHPSESKVLLRTDQSAFSSWDQFLVTTSSVAIVGSVLWVPAALVWTFRRWRQWLRHYDAEHRTTTAERRRRNARYAAWTVLLLSFVAWAPYKSKRVGEWIRVREWSLWKAWTRFVALEIRLDRPAASDHDLATDNHILAFCPHGIFPFAFALGVLSKEIFGIFRPIVASATGLFPIVRTLLGWLEAVDASRKAVQAAASSSTTNTRLGLVPGGIAEIFQGYPQPGTHPDEEYCIVRKGFLRLALEHQRPVVPIYCFGSTKMFRRLQIPLLEQISNLLRISLCLFYGVYGLPIPFRQRLLFVVGEPIVPPPSTTNRDERERAVQALHQQFCRALRNMFERHKHAYGWGNKTLHVVSK